MGNFNFNISYSLLSKFNDHKDGALCGYRFEQVNLRKQFEEPQSDLAAAGQWFEFKVTGALPRDGKEPEPQTTKTGKLTALYEHLSSQAAINFPLVYQGVKITEKGKELIVEDHGFRMKMILDVIAEEGLIQQVRDIKTTGNFNEWQGGWAHTVKHPFWSNPHILQAKMYIWAWWKLYGEIPDFYFDVFANNNPENFEVFQVIITEESLKIFEEELWMISTELKGKAQVEGFEPLPEFKRCRECKEITNKEGLSLYDQCPFKALKVTPIKVYVP